MNFKRVKHSFPCNNNLLWLLLNREASNECSYFLSSLPLGKLSKTFLTSPNTSMDNFQEKLASPRIEDKDCSIDWLGRQISLMCLMDGDPVDIGVINKPIDLITEQLSVIL